MDIKIAKIKDFSFVDYKKLNKKTLVIFNYCVDHFVSDDIKKYQIYIFNRNSLQAIKKDLEEREEPKNPDIALTVFIQNLENDLKNTEVVAYVVLE
jgi:hypothetical protein